MRLGIAAINIALLCIITLVMVRLGVTGRYNWNSFVHLFVIEGVSIILFLGISKLAKRSSKAVRAELSLVMLGVAGCFCVVQIIANSGANKNFPTMFWWSTIVFALSIDQHISKKNGDIAHEEK